MSLYSSKSSFCKIAQCLLTLVCVGVLAQPLTGQKPETKCDIDLTNPGHMKDIVSNALMCGLDKEETEIQKFLKGAESNYPDGKALLAAAASNFQVDEKALAAQVEKFRHCNCSHAQLETNEDDVNLVGSMPEPSPTMNQPANQPPGKDSNEKAQEFARNVVLHVVLHELGHALVREFDLPILGNEETLADAFATHYLTTHLPDRAVNVLTARVRSLMVEASEVPRKEWEVDGEHNNDARRAYQIASLAIAADPAKFAAVAEVAGMSADDIRNSRDYGAEIHRSWRRILQPLWMPPGKVSTEFRVRSDEGNKFISDFCSAELIKDIEETLGKFDWHSQVTVYFADGNGGAGWSRSKRTITVKSQYIQRFFKQASTLGPAKQ